MSTYWNIPRYDQLSAEELRKKSAFNVAVPIGQLCANMSRRYYMESVIGWMKIHFFFLH